MGGAIPGCADGSFYDFELLEEVSDFLPYQKLICTGTFTLILSYTNSSDSPLSEEEEANIKTTLEAIQEKFTDIPVSNASALKTYQGELYGFTFRFPERFEYVSIKPVARKSGIYIGKDANGNSSVLYKKTWEPYLTHVLRLQGSSEMSGDIAISVSPLADYSYQDVSGGVEYTYDVTAGTWSQNYARGSEPFTPKLYKETNWAILSWGDAGVIVRTLVIPIPERGIMVELSHYTEMGKSDFTEVEIEAMYASIRLSKTR